MHVRTWRFLRIVRGAIATQPAPGSGIAQPRMMSPGCAAHSGHSRANGQPLSNDKAFMLGWSTRKPWAPAHACRPRAITPALPINVLEKAEKIEPQAAALGPAARRPRPASPSPSSCRRGSARPACAWSSAASATFFCSRSFGQFWLLALTTGATSRARAAVGVRAAERSVIAAPSWALCAGTERACRHAERVEDLAVELDAVSRRSRRGRPSSVRATPHTLRVAEVWSSPNCSQA